MRDTACADSALRVVGRTLVNFQRLEHNLKLVARMGPLEGNLSKVQAQIERRRERSAGLTMGGAIQAWLSVADGRLTEIGFTPDLFDATMQVAVSFFPDVESLNAHGEALKSLLETRNNLVHGDLVHIKWESPEDCDRLIKRLERVNEEIDVQIRFIVSILQSVQLIGAIPYEQWLKVFEEL